MVAQGTRETRPREKRQDSSSRLGARTPRRLYRIAQSSRRANAEPVLPAVSANVPSAAFQDRYADLRMPVAIIAGDRLIDIERHEPR
jgi:hypothetical protein